MIQRSPIWRSSIPSTGSRSRGSRRRSPRVPSRSSSGGTNWTDSRSGSATGSSNGTHDRAGSTLSESGCVSIGISTRHPAPRVADYGSDGDAQWILTEALPGGSAVGDRWRARRPEAIRAIAEGLRAIHAIPIDDFPHAWTAQVWVGRQPPSLGPRPSIDVPVLVHGDACAPNTLISEDGVWTGNVDFGDLAIGDRWADLAIASAQPRLELRRGPPAGTLRRLRHHPRRGSDPLLPLPVGTRVLTTPDPHQSGSRGRP